MQKGCICKASDRGMRLIGCEEVTRGRKQGRDGWLPGGSCPSGLSHAR